MPVALLGGRSARQARAYPADRGSVAAGDALAGAVAESRRSRSFASSSAAGGSMSVSPRSASSRPRRPGCKTFPCRARRASRCGGSSRGAARVCGSTSADGRGPGGAGPRRHLPESGVRNCSRSTSRAFRPRTSRASRGLLSARASFTDALVLLDGIESIRGDDRRLDLDTLGVALGGQPGITILAGTQPWTPPRLAAGSASLGVLEVAIGAAEADLRSAHWQSELERRQIPATPEDISSLAARFRLTPAQIAEAVAAVEARRASLVRRPGHAGATARSSPRRSSRARGR